MDFEAINERISEIINKHTELEKKLFVVNQKNNYLSSLNEVLDELSDMVSEVSEKVEDWLDYVSDLADNMDDWLEEFYDMVDQFIDMAQNSIDQIGEYDEDDNEEYDFEQTAEKVVSVFETWEKQFSQLMELVKTGNNKVVEMFLTVSKLQNEVDVQSLSNMKQLVSHLVDWKKRIELAVSDFERWKDFVEKQVEDFEEFHENIKDVFE